MDIDLIPYHRSDLFCGSHFWVGVGLADLGLSPEEVGEKGSPTRVVTLSKVAKERKCEFVDGEPEQQAEKLIQHLLETGLIG